MHRPVPVSSLIHASTVLADCFDDAKVIPTLFGPQQGEAHFHSTNGCLREIMHRLWADVELQLLGV
eukprot:11281986-Alexandrium_andersonii.AAC.1